MDQVIDKRDELRQEAITSWIKNNYFGTVVMPTGTGKSFVGIRAIEEVINIKSRFNDDDVVVLHMSERSTRELGFNDEIDKYTKLYGIPIKSKLNIIYKRYQNINSIFDQCFSNKDLFLIDDI